MASPSDLCVWCRRGAMLDGLASRVFRLDGTTVVVCDIHLGIMVAAAIVDREVSDRERWLNWPRILALPEGTRA